MSARIPCILIYVFRGFPQSLEVNEDSLLKQSNDPFDSPFTVRLIRSQTTSAVDG